MSGVYADRVRPELPKVLLHSRQQFLSPGKGWYLAKAWRSDRVRMWLGSVLNPGIKIKTLFAEEFKIYYTAGNV
jgi:hypothetical protein